MPGQLRLESLFVIKVIQSRSVKGLEPKSVAYFLT